MSLSIICALAKNRAIGNKGDLLYHLRADLKRFKALTTGHTIIMGRKTFESLPKGALPNRRNVVLTRQIGYSAPGIEVFASLSEALQHLQPEEHAYIIGGASVYAEALPLADTLCLTHIHATPAEADVFFPEINSEEWKLTFEEHHEADEQNDQPFTFADYARKL